MPGWLTAACCMVGGSGPGLRRAAKRFLEDNPDALGGLLSERLRGSKQQQQQVVVEPVGLLLGVEAAESLLMLDRADWEDDADRHDCSLCRKVGRTKGQAHIARLALTGTTARQV